MKIHELKIDPEHLKAIENGLKTFELRRFDREFEVGDYLFLRGYDRAFRTYTDDMYMVEITYIISDHECLAPGCCCISIERNFKTIFALIRKWREIRRQNFLAHRG